MYKHTTHGLYLAHNDLTTTVGSSQLIASNQDQAM